jgi:HD-like signal output (HDOD) protein
MGDVMEKKHILFVDDEPMVLQGLQRMFRDKRSEWEMSFVTSGQEALECLSRKACHVLVSDFRMPGMNGAELLNEVKKRFPGVIRMILSGQTDQEGIVTLARQAHQYLSKPCDPEAIRSSIERELQLNDLLTSESVKRVISAMETLPSSPVLYGRLMEELKGPEPSINAVAEIVSSDVGMTAKLLQLVNSAFFALPHRVSHVSQAVSFLGLDTVKTLVLSIHIFSQFDREKLSMLDLDEIWEHSLTTGLFAKTISRVENQSQFRADDALMGGMLHDAGKLVLASNFPREYAAVDVMVKEEGASVCEAEGRVLDGATHAEIGAYLMGLWGLPHSIVNAITFHHRPYPDEMRDFNVAVAVYAANLIGHGSEEGFPAGGLLRERLPVWKEACMAAAGQGRRDA